MAQPPARYDVLITEIMADPDPAIGLPNAEYIELKNRSNQPLNLQGWRITTASAVSGAFPPFVLQPDSFVIVTTAAQRAALSAYGTTISVPSFPALLNGGTTLTLIAAEGKTIHAVAYTDAWYNNAVKATGGWSLELIDDNNPCTGAANWTASTAAAGGTPGRPNAVARVNRDETPPALISTVVANPTVLLVQFSEPLDSNSAVAFANYRLQPAIEIVGVKALNPFLQQVELSLAAPLDSNTLYTLTVLQVGDCSGNVLGSRNRLPVGRARSAEAADVIINELLFNPKPGGSDYIELYNRSPKVLDLSQLYLAGRSSSGQVTAPRKTLQNLFYLFPGSYVVLTEDSVGLPLRYFVPDIEAVVQTSSLPSMPDDAGKVVLLNAQGLVIDEVHYTKDWHFGLIREDEGVALERIDPNGPSGEKSNWHSAASTVGYGTPTYKNSQYRQSNFTGATIAVTPKTFSPDGDGVHDFATIQYHIEGNGFVAIVTIFDAAGRPVRHLVKNALMAQQGAWRWDGLNESGQRLPMGTYVILTELFNSKGEKKHFKQTVVLARRF